MKNIFEVETIKHDLGLSDDESAEFEMWVEEQEAMLDNYDYPVSHDNWAGGCEWAR